MKATNTPFKTNDLAESVDRIDAVLDARGGNYEVRKSIPAEEELTFENGFYVDCTAIFIDIRDSSRMTKAHARPVLAKLYRAYTSEAVAVINSDPACRHVAINGDCVSGYISTPYKSDVNRAFETAAMLNSMMAVLNWKLEKKGYTAIRCGIGLAYGTALMVKAGYKGVAINEIAWMGDVVNSASNLCGLGNKSGRKAVQVSGDVQLNLNDAYKALLNPVYDQHGGAAHYETNASNIAMDAWLTEQRKRERGIQGIINALLRPQPQTGFEGLLGLGLSAPQAAQPTHTLRDLLYLGETPPAPPSPFP